MQGFPASPNTNTGFCVLLNLKGCKFGHQMTRQLSKDVSSCPTGNFDALRRLKFPFNLSHWDILKPLYTMTSLSTGNFPKASVLEHTWTDCCKCPLVFKPEIESTLHWRRRGEKHELPQMKSSKIHREVQKAELIKMIPFHATSIHLYNFICEWGSSIQKHMGIQASKSLSFMGSRSLCLIFRSLSRDLC